MSFYVTLPSNSSSNVFPKNTLTDYSTKLKSPIQLEGAYEVALVEMMYPVSWKYQTGSVILKWSDVEVVNEIEFIVHEKMKNICKQISEFFSNPQLSQIQCEFVYNESSQRISISFPKEATLIFTNNINLLFGFTKTTLEPREDNSVFISDLKVRELTNTINTLYVYSDITEYQVVGDENAPLLQVVASNHDNSVMYIDKI